MPNQGNKSNGKSGVVQKKKSSTMPSVKKQDAENKATKPGDGNNDQNQNKTSPGDSAKE